MNLVTVACSNGLIMLDASEASTREIKRFGSELVSTFSFSLNGMKYAYSFNDSVKVYCSQTHNLLVELDYKNVSKCTFSPDGSVIALFQNYNSSSKEPNMRFVELDSGKCLREITQNRANIWKPYWTNDSSVCARFSQEEIHIFQNNRFDESPSCKIAAKNVHTFALGPRGPNTNLAIFVAASKGQPGFVAIHSIQNGIDFGLIIRKSFYKADYVKLLWNDRGTDLLIIATIAESHKSYYGEQILYFMTTNKGGEAANVQLPKDDSFFDVKWLPTQLPLNSSQSQKKGEDRSKNTGSLFAVCHGQLPSTVTVFGTDCEPKFNFGKGPWNTILLNPLGNLIMMGGFGNIPGNISIWDIYKKEKICAIKCEDTTHVAWCDDGKHFLTATTTPRLRVNNGFKVYNYKGELTCSWSIEKRANPKPATADLPAQIFHELHNVIICPLSADSKPKKCFEIEKKIMSSDSKKTSGSGVYVPPSLRNARNDNASGRKIGPVGGISIATTGESNIGKKPKSQASNNPEFAARSKQISNLKTKLKQIEKLKQEQANGKTLDAAQKLKVESEDSLAQQLTQLQLMNH